MGAFNHWFHVNGNTKGTWLRGSDLGYRERHRRIPIEGDYRNPPREGIYRGVKERLKSLMQTEPVYLNARARKLACEEIVGSLQSDRIEVIACAVDSHHYHILARFVDNDPRPWVGRAKGRSALTLAEASLAKPGGVWAVRCKVTPIKDRAHQLAVARYILAHAERGASTWKISPRKPRA